LPGTCVGKVTCCERLASDKCDRNAVVWESDRMLKSPVIKNSWGVVAAEQRKEWNSSRKVAND